MNPLFQIVADLLQPYYPSSTIIDLRNLAQPEISGEVVGYHFSFIDMIDLAEHDLKTLKILLQEIPLVQFYQALHDLTLGCSVELWYHYYPDDVDQAMPIFYLVAKPTTVLPYVIVECGQVSWIYYELDQVTIYASDLIRSIFLEMSNIDDWIHQVNGVYKRSSRQEWWSMALEYARADPDHLSETRLARLVTDHPDSELDREGDYPTVERITTLINEIDARRSTYAQGCPSVAIRSFSGRKSGSRIFQAIMPEILRRHCRPSYKSARSAEY